MKPHAPKPPLGSPFRCRSCALMDNQLSKVGSARHDGSDFGVKFQIACNSCGACSALCSSPDDARESWRLMSGEVVETPPPIVPSTTEPVADQPEDVWLGVKKT